MSNIALTRGQFLLPFALILEGLGTPVESLLEEHKLPGSLENSKDDYVPIRSAIQFAEAASRKEGIPDFGFLVARDANFDYLSARLRIQILNSPTLLSALMVLCANAHMEDTNLHMFLERGKDSARLHSRLIGVKGLRNLEHSQWLQNVLPIHVVRQFVGSAWVPATIAFEAQYTPGMDAQEHWPASRFLSAQRYSWIDIPAKYLSLPPIQNSVIEDSSCIGSAYVSGKLVESLKLMLPSYLGGRIPSVREVAEMAHTSVRNLQRTLGQSGLSYRDILNNVKFERAAQLLSDPGVAITDIARSLGYADGAHFTRAFRRMAGVPPMQYRHQRRQDGCPAKGYRGEDEYKKP